MKKGQKLWSREELILAINLYCKTTFGRLHNHNPDIKELAQLLGRTPSSLTWKLVNFASLDPSLKARGIKGASNASKLDNEIWNEFYHDWENLAFESEALLASLKEENIENKFLNNLSISSTLIGKERLQMVKTRVNQAFFRKTILASYNNTCCITGINVPEFLIASHIIPWAEDKGKRMNPSNGLCLNALHDKAFETGLLAVTPAYKIKISEKLLKADTKDSITNVYFENYHNKSINLPKRFLPDPEFLDKHYSERFQK